MKVLITITCLCILATTGYLANKEYRTYQKEQVEEADREFREVIGSLKRAYKAAGQ